MVFISRGSHRFFSPVLIVSHFDVCSFDHNSVIRTTCCCSLLSFSLSLFLSQTHTLSAVRTFGDHVLYDKEKVFSEKATTALISLYFFSANESTEPVTFFFNSFIELICLFFDNFHYFSLFFSLGFPLSFNTSLILILPFAVLDFGFLTALTFNITNLMIIS